MERPHSFSITVAALLVVSSFASQPARAVNPDVCASAGGTAECTGPEVGEYRYIAGSVNWPGIPASLWWSSEQQAMETLLEYGEQVYHACTQNLDLPSWLPLPAGTVGMGTRTVGNVATGFWEQKWTLGVEYEQRKEPVRITGTFGTNTAPPCVNQLNSGPMGSHRVRGVNCPVGFDVNGYTAPTWAYCWRAPQNKPDPPKNLGPCTDCELSKGNPINIATGNK